jgi:hypothetical protein
MDRESLLQSYADGYDKFTATLKKMPKDMWQFKPAPDKWNVHEIIIHMADAEVNGYIRARKIIAEPGSLITAYDQDLWVIKTDYHKQSTDEALELFRLLRSMTYKILKELPDETWHNTILHPENGVMTLDDWLTSYEGHVTSHVNQLEKILKEWKHST